MRFLSPQALVLAITAAALAVAATASVTSGLAMDDGPTDGKKAGPAGCTCPDSDRKPAARRKFAETKPDLDENDEIAALESVQLALSELSDGATYVWHRRRGALSGFVQPTASFKDRAGNVCRHVVLVLSTDAGSRKAEGIACRLSSGRWQLEG